MDVDVLTCRGTKEKWTQTPSIHIRTNPMVVPTSTDTKHSKGIWGFLGRSKWMLIDRWESFRNSIGSQDISQPDAYVQAHSAETYLHTATLSQPMTASTHARVTRFSLFLDALNRPLF